MGRPINKRNFGINANNNLKVQFFNGTASVPGYIVSQRGAKKFLCSDATGARAICFLVDKAAGALTAGEMSITVKFDDGAVEQVTKISGGTLTAGGVKRPWNFSVSTGDGAVQVEEAGSGINNNSTAGDVSDDFLNAPTDLEGDE
jgi:hypothetical protein